MPPAARSVTETAAAALRSLTFDQRMAAGLFVLMALLPLLSALLGGTYLLLIAGSFVAGRWHDAKRSDSATP